MGSAPSKTPEAALAAGGLEGQGPARPTPASSARSAKPPTQTAAELLQRQMVERWNALDIQTKLYLILGLVRTTLRTSAWPDAKAPIDSSAWNLYDLAVRFWGVDVTKLVGALLRTQIPIPAAKLHFSREVTEWLDAYQKQYAQALRYIGSHPESHSLWDPTRVGGARKLRDTPGAYDAIVTSDLVSMPRVTPEVVEGLQRLWKPILRTPTASASAASSATASPVAVPGRDIVVASVRTTPSPVPSSRTPSRTPPPRVQEAIRRAAETPAAESVGPELAALMWEMAKYLKAIKKHFQAVLNPTSTKYPVANMVRELDGFLNIAQERFSEEQRRRQLRSREDAERADPTLLELRQARDQIEPTVEEDRILLDELINPLPMAAPIDQIKLHKLMQRMRVVLAWFAPTMWDAL